jgi:hypothetical protein
MCRSEQHWDSLSSRCFVSRIQIPHDAGLSSSLIYDWGGVVDRAAHLFGCSVYHVGKPNRLPTPDLLIHALEIIQDSIGRGIPALVWNITSCEFGIVYGYDDVTQHLTYRGANRSSLRVPYYALCRSEHQQELFVAAMGSPVHWSGLSEREIRLSLNVIAAHARGNEMAVDGYVGGLTAYDTWIEALRTLEVDPVNHAYNVALLTEARQHAVCFLEMLSAHRIFIRDSDLNQYLLAALEDYRNVYCLFMQLYPSFPFGLPGIHLDLREHFVLLLQQIKAAEAQGDLSFGDNFSQIRAKCDRSNALNASL